MAKAKSQKKEKQAKDMGSIADIVSQHSEVTPAAVSKPKPTKAAVKTQPKLEEPKIAAVVEAPTIEQVENKIENKVEEVYDRDKTLFIAQVKADEDSYNREELPKKIKKLDAALKKLPEDASTGDVLKAAFKAWDDGATIGLQW